MSWRVAESLEILRLQLNEAFPDRSVLSDGSIGDTDHSNRTSDHNPHCGPGVVTARDFTHDPEKGADMGKVSEALRRSRDGRIKYVIYNRQMFSAYPTSAYPAWTWRPYSGPNAHLQHMHVSVNCGGHMDSTTPWEIGADEVDYDKLRQIVKEEVTDARRKLAVGKTQPAYDADKVNLETLAARLKALEQKCGKCAGCGCK